jgi:hypothetical protein
MVMTDTRPVAGASRSTIRAATPRSVRPLASRSQRNMSRARTAIVAGVVPMSIQAETWAAMASSSSVSELIVTWRGAGPVRAER